MKAMGITEELDEYLENLNEEQLKQLMICVEERLLERKKPIQEGYEEEFIALMLDCGLDLLNARINLIDFKTVASAYFQGAGPVYLEDLQYAMEVVFRKNGYVPTYEAKQLINGFIEKTFGQNIPSMVGSLII